MNINRILLFFLSISMSIYTYAVYEHPIVVVIPSYNNVQICKGNLSSVFAQTYHNYRVIYIDDASDDGTYEAVCAYVTECDQWHRVLVIKNKERRKQMFNHYYAVHMCDNNEIIVNLDGDDFLAKDALEVINSVYENDAVWMTYGQYREEPHGKHGHCRKIPDIVRREHAYRYYDWVTSHPRTFYAGLFKQIPIGYFLHEGDFQPCAVDLAMMFSMLELSGGRAQFIDKVLYHYNCANPNNVFRKNLLQQLQMGYISRGRQPLAPLTFDPRKPMVRDTTTSCIGMIVVSEHNPEALSSFLASWKELDMHCDMHIVYNAFNTDMRIKYLDIASQYDQVHIKYIDQKRGLKQTLLDMFDTLDCSHVVLTSDAIPFNKKCDFNHYIELLEKTHACGFYFDRDATATHYKSSKNICPPLVNLEKDIYAWQFKHATGQWRIVYSCDGALYRMNDLRKAIEEHAFNSLDELRHAWYLVGAARQEDVGLCCGKP